MEATANFAAGLQMAHDQLLAEGKLKKEDGVAVRKLLANPLVVKPNGDRIRPIYRAHVRVRTLYVKSQRLIVIGALDWTKLVEWLKEHWMEVVKTILSIVLFIL
jgi:hypothetical protein